MAVVIAFAVALAALKAATQLSVNIAFNLVVAGLLIATYKAKCARGVEGTWWAGCASFGWAHLVLGLIGMPWGQHYGVAPDLITAEITWRLTSLLEPDMSPAAGQRVTSIALVLHCVLSVVVALLGGTIFRFAAARSSAWERAGHQLDTDSNSP
jgi:hypothetical protein